MSGWNNFPLSDGDDISGWDLLIQYWYALRERHAVLTNDCVNWPDPTVAWFDGTSDTVTDNGDGTYDVYFSSVNWDVLCAGSTQRWVDYYCTGVCPPVYLPTTYDCVFIPDENHPLKTVRGTITVETYSGPAGSSGTVTISGAAIANAITAKFITLSDLESCRVVFVSAGTHHGITSSERLPDEPQDRPLWIGTTSTGGTITDEYGVTQSYLTDTTPKNTQYEQRRGWIEDEWIDKELMVFGDGLLRRLSITSNTKDTLYFDEQPFTVSGQYAIVEVDAKYLVGKREWKPYQWYYGDVKSYVTHMADDTVGTWPEASTQKTWDEGDPCTDNPCEPTAHNTFDIDASIAIDSLCESDIAGDFVAPEFWKSIRQMQNYCLSICGNFVRKPAEGTDLTGTCIHNYTPATLLLDAGCDGGTTTLAYDGTDYYFNVDSVFDGLTIYYQVEKSACGLSSGTATVSSGLINLGSSGYTSDDVGSVVTYSPGWSRYRPRWAKYCFPKTSFIPDYRVSLEGGIIVIDPPNVAYTTDEFGETIGPPYTYDCLGKGRYQYSPPSSNYAEHSGVGMCVEGSTAFIEGEYLRLQGDNACDPFGNGGISELAVYYDKLYRGTYSDPHNKARIISKKGYVSSATNYSLTDTTKDWLNDGVSNHSGGLRTETGTASGGSTTTLEDSSKDTTDTSQPWGCWHSDDRFNGFGNYVGFTLIITRVETSSSSSSSESLTTSYKVLITSSTHGSGGVTYTFNPFNDEDGIPFEVMSGDTYSITEPAYELNKWIGRRLVVQHQDEYGSEDVYWIIGSDDDTLFVEDVGYPIASEGDVYRIIEPEYGTVWKFTTTEPSEGIDWWPITGGYIVKPIGADTTRVGVPVTPENFRHNQKYNLETYVKDYGPIMCADAINTKTLNQLYNAINLEVWQRGDSSWAIKTYWNGGGSSTFDATTVTDDGSGSAPSPLTGSEDATGAFFRTYLYLSPVDSGSNGSYTYENNSLVPGVSPGSFTVKELNEKVIARYAGVGDWDTIAAAVESVFYTPATVDGVVDWAQPSGESSIVSNYTFGSTLPKANANMAFEDVFWDGSEWFAFDTQAVLDVAQARLKLTLDNPCFACGVDYYAYSTKLGDEFDAWGGSLLENSWAKFGGLTYPINSGIVWSDMLGWGSPHFWEGLYPIDYTDSEYSSDGDWLTVENGVQRVIFPGSDTTDFLLNAYTGPVYVDATHVKYEFGPLHGDAPSSGTFVHAYKGIAKSKGYQVSDKAAIIRWDVEGGFQFTF